MMKIISFDKNKESGTGWVHIEDDEGLQWSGNVKLKRD
jgi:hypothetical protein